MVDPDGPQVQVSASESDDTDAEVKLWGITHQGYALVREEKANPLVQSR